jgi:hypothetical protein
MPTDEPAERTQDTCPESIDLKMSTMRVAVAGTGGLACLIAHSINEQTSHSVVLLSRAVSSRVPDSSPAIIACCLLVLLYGRF